MPSPETTEDRTTTLAAAICQAWEMLADRQRQRHELEAYFALVEEIVAASEDEASE